MKKIQIMDTNGSKVDVLGIYFISHNNYYFIYTKEENDNEGHVILYISKVLQEAINTPNGPQPTGYLLGTKVVDDDEYDFVKQDIINIINEKQNGGGNAVRYLDLSMLSNFKSNDYRLFKLDIDTFNKTFKSENINQVISNNDMVMDYRIKYEDELKNNEKLMQDVERLQNKIDKISKIINEN